MRDLVRIGSEKVVVCGRTELCEGQSGHEDRARNSRGETIGDFRHDAIEDEGDGCGDDDVGDHQGSQSHAEELKQKSVPVGRERAVQVDEIPVDRVARHEAPRNVEFATEVDEGVGAVIPAPAEAGSAQPGDEKRTEHPQQRSRAFQRRFDLAGDRRPDLFERCNARVVAGRGLGSFAAHGARVAR